MWIYLLIFELFCSITPHLFYFKGIEKVTASDAGVILLLEPIGATALADIGTKLANFHSDEENIVK